MIQINRKVFYWILQIVGWCSYGGLIFIASYNKVGFSFGFKFFINLFFTVLLGILLSHQIRNRIKSKELVKILKKSDLLRIVTLVLFTSLVFVLLTKAIIILLNWSVFQIEFISFIINWASFFVLFGFWVTLYYGYHLFEQTQRQELDNLLLKASQSELELQNLRSQLNPHFLFNALNSIRALVEVNPAKAKEAVTLLAKILRFSLSTSNQSLVTIEHELQLVDSYLKLEKVRYEERLRIVKHVEGDLLQQKIPAFTIQTLVENGVKHGISKLIQGGEIVIRVSKLEHSVCILVSNSGEIGTQKDLGIGLINLRKRLDIEYGNAYSFSIKQNEMVDVEIRISTNSSSI